MSLRNSLKMLYPKIYVIFSLSLDGHASSSFTALQSLIGLGNNCPFMSGK